MTATESMEVVDIGSVSTHPDNARVHDLDAIAGSLQRFGQTKPIVVQRSTGHILAGNGTRRAAVNLGWKKIGVVWVDCSDEEARAYLAADNRASDRAAYDSERLLTLLCGLEDLDGTGFDDEYVENLGDEVDRSVAVPSDPPPSDSSDFTGGDAVEDDVSDESDAPERPTPEPVRDIVMLMTVSRAQRFAGHVQTLQRQWGTASVVDTVERAVAEAVGDA